jgi:glycosyltransferase involved in cell wall biosynthesis
VDKFIVLTKFAGNRFKDSILKVSPDAFVVKPNFVVDYGLGQLDREEFFLYVGRLSVEKGVVTLLESTKFYRYNLVIIGDGPSRNLVEKEAVTNTQIKYLGFQPKEVIMNYLKKCKALLLPSKWYEGMPMIMLEAFSTGTPVIASRLGAMEEMVQHNCNGLHFNPGDPKDLADKVQQADTQPDFVKKLSQQARDSYTNYYTPQINYTILKDIYAQVLLKGKR